MFLTLYNLTVTKIKFKTVSPYIIAFLLIILFIFLRFYKITESLLFFNDIGRDFLVLRNWQVSHKPPLLGPQTSAIPFNQSAIYFYLLYPFFLVTRGSVYATLIAAAFFYLSSFILGLYFLRKQNLWQNSLLLVFFLISIHPQYIVQNRFVWNPSFVTPPLLLAFYSFLALREKYLNKKNLDQILTWLFTFALALALGFSYSVFPAFLAFLILAFIVFKKHFFSISFKTAIALFIVNLPTIVFELRHNFLLSNMLFTREKMPQPANYLMAKLKGLNLYIFNLPNLFYLLFFVLLITGIIYLMKKQKKLNFPLIFLLALFCLTLLITLISPIAIQAHYIFPLTVIFFLLISLLLLNNRLLIIIFLFFTLIWLKPSRLTSYFAPAYRSVNDSINCATAFCQSHPQALFVSVQSDHHPYHNAMEWQYLLVSNGCQLKDLVTASNQAEYMAVVVDDSQYEHNQTAFNELTIFGPSEEMETFICQENLEIRVLKKVEVID